MKARTVNLDEIVAETQYGTPALANERRRGLPVLRMGNLTFDGEIDLTDLKWVELADRETEQFTVQPGDLLFNRTNSPQLVGKAAVWHHREQFAFAGYLIRVRFKRDLADPEYVSACLNSPWGKTRLRAMAKDSINMSNINATELLRFTIPLPSLPEQRKMAEQIREAYRLRHTRRYALELSDTFLPAAFRQYFGARFHDGPFGPLGDLVRITGGGTPSRDRPDFFNGRIPWLTSKDMRGDFIWDTDEHITQEAIENSATNLVPVDSVLVVVKSKVLMHRLPVAIAKIPMCHGQDIKSIQCSQQLHPEFAPLRSQIPRAPTS